ncbi:MAG: YaiO family outer membrane beta-barrel protein [Polaromonas sp.]|nr:YaiO family outer membrane beta-barrel protein [Polaromonas sp.]
MKNKTIQISSAVVAAVLVQSVWADVATPGGATTHIELSADSSRLSNGTPDWRETTLRLTRKLSRQSARTIELTQTNRFGLDDQEISGLLSTPLSDKLTATVSGSISPTHRVLARQRVEGSIQYEFAPAWLVHGGLGHRRYDTVRVDQANLMLEHYFSSFSVSAAWKPVRASGVSSESAELRFSYYYGDANFAGLIVSNGQEATSITPSTVVLADVRAIALLGRHWLTRQWAMNYALTRAQQGNFYTRNSVRLGAEYAF